MRRRRCQACALEFKRRSKPGLRTRVQEAFEQVAWEMGVLALAPDLISSAILADTDTD
ncbi:hypothetical protein [Nocardia pseudovaccinii]|uniref:hypothetical protein n=1 Tax=Nocardia pseudovaccinii TaxID=189540 RepID=UPI000AE2B633|nr:hypothetical protein [Nocardia pseudovaccinii]